MKATTHIPEVYKGKYKRLGTAIPMSDCLRLISSVIENPYYDEHKETINMYRAMFIKILLRYLIRNNGVINTTDDLIDIISKLYRINTTIYYNNMYVDCFYYVVGMFNSLIRLYRVIDVESVDVREGAVILRLLVRE